MIRSSIAAVFFVVALTSWAGVAKAAYSDACKTPKGEQGKCMPLNSCRDVEQHLRAVLNGGTSLSPDYVSYLQRADCGEFDGSRHICCPEAEIQPHRSVMDLFESRHFSCGQFSGPKAAHGKEVRLKSRPWMALLKYHHDGVDQFLCGGTLISNRYILTAAHCVHGLEDELFEVRLGEHKISTERDCAHQGRLLKCAPPVQNVGIEKVITHEQFDETYTYNDIALLRLNRTIGENHIHIKPICLPINEELKQQAEELNELLVTGWGTTEKNEPSDVLMQAKVPRRSRNVCADAHHRLVPQTQLCVGGGDLQDSCKGDSGGPLQAMAKYQDKIRMVEFGIVSLGVTSCGRVSSPGLYTNVAEYIQWITDKMAIYGL